MDDASYEECQSALRLSMVSQAMVRRVGYPLYARIVELSHLLLDYFFTTPPPEEER